MRRWASILMVILAAFLSAAAHAGPVPGAEAVDVTGELDGVAYRIQMPADWNGGLVMYAHGYMM
ncbi:MAG TPA: hypothetical protein VLA34_06505, partial [Candidatus Krumholzibacterium sp.]|nr:hypothetical protein [Candidatus Krumholzibacterium sp.]